MRPNLVRNLTLALAFVSPAWPAARAADVDLNGNWKLAGQILAASFGSDFTFTNGAALNHGQCSGARERPFSQPVTVLWGFPNFLVMTQAGSLCVAQLQPVALARTRCRVSIFNASSHTARPEPANTPSAPILPKKCNGRVM